MSSVRDPEDEGLHAWAFFSHTTNGEPVARTVRSLQEASTEDGPIIFATETVGPVKGLAHVRVDAGRLDLLQDLMRDLEREHGLGSEYATLGPAHRTAAGVPRPAKPKKCEVMAFVRIWVAPGRATDVLQAVGPASGEVFDGASIVFGGFDVLLTLDASTYGELEHAILEDLHGVEGIVRSQTLFADLRRYGDYASNG
jgi:hypothetical protein